ncbi:hypothetical protein [Bradyrhizobium elkanii]|uniref:hypothetical protein n=1 Tax=Bradyrhizobium elkanii TaxID=29448 RepID=UPI0004B0D417|nr:hypothetical protein [Bradyrhizobium elkanii]
MIDLIQQRIAPAILSSVEISPITILKTEPGMAPVPTIKSALASSSSDLSLADGDWRTGGYLAGLQELIDAELRWADENRPKLIEAAQQSLKRLFPLLVSDAFTVAKDLTNPAGRSKSPGYGHLKLPHLMIAVSAEQR